MTVITNETQNYHDVPCCFSSGDTLMVACTNVTLDREGTSMISQDCVNGTWYKGEFNGGSTNYSFLTYDYFKERDVEENKVAGIAYEGDITIYNSTK